MSETLDLTIVYEVDEGGWHVASIPEPRGVHSQGRTRQEARENVLSALNDWLRFYVKEQGSTAGVIPEGAESEPLHLTFAA